MLEYYSMENEIYSQSQCRVSSNELSLLDEGSHSFLLQKENRECRLGSNKTVLISCSGEECKCSKSHRVVIRQFRSPFYNLKISLSMKCANYLSLILDRKSPFKSNVLQRVRKAYVFLYYRWGSLSKYDKIDDFSVVVLWTVNKNSP